MMADPGFWSELVPRPENQGLYESGMASWNPSLRRRMVQMAAKTQICALVLIVVIVVTANRVKSPEKCFSSDRLQVIAISCFMITNTRRGSRILVKGALSLKFAEKSGVFP